MGYLMRGSFLTEKMGWRTILRRKERLNLLFTIRILVSVELKHFYIERCDNVYGHAYEHEIN